MKKKIVKRKKLKRYILVKTRIPKGYEGKLFEMIGQFVYIHCEPRQEYSKLLQQKEISLEQVGQKAKDNHIWLNAFMCIRPTDEFKLQLADTILAN